MGKESRKEKRRGSTADADVLLPSAFAAATSQMMGTERWQLFERAMADEPTVSVRLNPHKIEDKGQPLQVAGIDITDMQPVPWSRHSFYLPRRPLFTADPLLHAGVYYVQEASSMFIDTVLRQYVGDNDIVLLDLSAAPGGKATLARTAVSRGSLVIANEPVRQRAAVLSENMQKWGAAAVIVTSNYAADICRTGISFDIIVADVPCSGEGMFRKDPVARRMWSLRTVEQCRRLQRSIVSDIWQCLKPGGLMIYSTCTFNVDEDENNVMYIADELGADILPVDIDSSWGITGSLSSLCNEPVYRFIPGLTRGEGLFMAVLKKRGQPAADPPQRHSRTSSATDVPPWLRPDIAGEMSFTRLGDIITAIPKRWQPLLDTVRGRLNVVHAGITIGTIKGNDIIPDHSLAMSADINTAAFNIIDIDNDQATAYLRRQTLQLPPSAARGHILLTYKGHPIGFANNIGTRANNMYPKSWRILK